MGADNLAQIRHWKRWREIFALVPIAVFARPAYCRAALAELAANRFAHARLDASAARGLARMKPPAWVFLWAEYDSSSATELRVTSKKPASRIPPKQKRQETAKKPAKSPRKKSQKTNRKKKGNRHTAQQIRQSQETSSCKTETVHAAKAGFRPGRGAAEADRNRARGRQGRGHRSSSICRQIEHRRLHADRQRALGSARSRRWPSALIEAFEAVGLRRAFGRGAARTAIGC